MVDESKQDIAEQDDDFFAGKRPWSVIKDDVLRFYLPPYLRKVGTLRRRILLVDGYAGPGTFGDGTEGSPLIMLREAEKHALRNYEAIFVNKEEKYHHRLMQTLSPLERWSGRVRPTLADSYQFLGDLAGHLANYTVFLYLDPFGLKGCGFNVLQPFLTRDPRWSTEIVLTMSMPVLHRLAAPHASQHGTTARMRSNHQTLTTALGGEEWQAIMWDDARTPEEKAFAVIQLYHDRIRRYLPYTGFCPVRAGGEGSLIKYFMLFASRHPDAMELMNDAMARAYFRRMHEAEFADTLLASLDWRSLRSTDGKLDALPDEILTLVGAHPGITRHALWLRLIRAQFMRYTSSEFKDVVKRMIKEGALKARYTDTRRLNDETKLFLPE